MYQDNAVHRYVAAHGVACPRCDHQQIESADNIEFVAGTIRQRMRCTTCDAHWWDIYTLTDIQIEP